MTIGPHMRSDDTPSIRLAAEGLAIRRGDRPLFSDLDFGIEGGQVLQIEGQNGCGKTTLLRILCTLTQPSEGRLVWNGTPLDEVLPDYLAELVYVGHHPAVKDDLTPLENLAFSRLLSRPKPDADPEQALERLGLEVDYETLPCRKLSAGQRRRVALARLLLSDARVWVLDEPFTALDVRGRDLVEALLAEHAMRGGIAILTTHHAVSVVGAPVHRLHLG